VSGESATPRYWVRLSVPRIGGLRVWGLAEGDFERRLAMQASAMVSGPHIAGETRRGRSFLEVTIAMARPGSPCLSGPPRGGTPEPPGLPRPAGPARWQPSTTATEGRTITIGPHEARLAAARQAQADPA
jgi:hypothetical protein